MKRVCIVDDDASLTEALSILLEEEGYTVSVYADAAAALSPQSDPPAVYIIDLQLSGDVSGEKLISALRQRSQLAGVPIIIMSGAVDGADQARRLNVSYLPKPSSVDTVLEAIAAVTTRA